MKYLTHRYQNATEQERAFIIGTLLSLTGLLLLVSKLIAGGAFNGQSLIGLICAWGGLLIIGNQLDKNR